MPATQVRAEWSPRGIHVWEHTHWWEWQCSTRKYVKGPLWILDRVRENMFKLHKLYVAVAEQFATDGSTPYPSMGNAPYFGLELSNGYGYLYKTTPRTCGLPVKMRATALHLHSYSTTWEGTSSLSPPSLRCRRQRYHLLQYILYHPRATARIRLNSLHLPTPLSIFPLYHDRCLYWTPACWT